MGADAGLAVAEKAGSFGVNQQWAAAAAQGPAQSMGADIQKMSEEMKKMEGHPMRTVLYMGSPEAAKKEAARQAREFQTSASLELARYIAHGALHLLGFDDQAPRDRRLMKREEDRLTRLFLWSRADTIYGGSNQIQRNVIGEQALGLPKEPR